MCSFNDDPSAAPINPLQQRHPDRNSNQSERQPKAAPIARSRSFATSRATIKSEDTLPLQKSTTAHPHDDRASHCTNHSYHRNILATPIPTILQMAHPIK
ncbi:uncharacterized protein MYCGRDRAFT_104876 [Zymoseptoria tritici IPO323]|uniref:Uncharacterized protein n=1 Tax=Zymoseptoria tritici (strain CBS 115943 / IPO323) TaxID=336722 RepID=F9XDH4_ZYMTI|nr:uncharacterized protein MYCGRDRAFT_104876 [Zymoseptoria tritici IPO323]EGP86493.1 hypothetical protein MYCGRDRAFT_104876 [Zymoseptoria tritici IPO323]